jgi:cytochrome c1
MRRPGLGGAVVAVAVAVAVGGLAPACRGDARSRPPSVAFGDPAKGGQAIVEYGCGSCHVIPGIRSADSLVGPPLTGFGRRSFVAGSLPNSAENLARWIQDPLSIRPGTAMPDLGVTEVQARDIAAYLHSLR